MKNSYEKENKNGEICAGKDDGTKSRVVVEKELFLRNIYPINPVTLESSKTGIKK